VGTLYLLDTNILVHYVRGSAVWERLREEYQLLLIEPKPVICVVTVGEIRSLAYQWQWEEAKRSQMAFALGYFGIVNINTPDILESYALMDSYLERQGQSLGKNDLWIAATTQASGARLLTTDRDFDRLHPTFLDRDWIDPSTR
jgi:predicted nucleic acid-binding protein